MHSILNSRQQTAASAHTNDRSVGKDVQSMAVANRWQGQIKSPAPVASDVIQGKWIINADGNVVEVDDKYKLKKGEHDIDMSLFTSQPSVLVEKGSKKVVMDKDGSVSSEDMDEEIPTHKELQEKRSQQGGELLERFQKLKPKQREIQIAELEKMAESIEKEMGDMLPDNHSDKVEKLYESGVTGPKFRAIEKGLDEITQSQSTTAFLKGFKNDKIIDEDDESDVNAYGTALLRVMSALRLPTQTVVAPIEYDDEVTGQQHPTSKDQPKLEGGSSGHSYSDRLRVHKQTQAFDNLSQSEKISPNKLALGTFLSAGISTLSSMSAPLTAKNVPEFHEEEDDRIEQVEQREKLKRSSNKMAFSIGLPGGEGMQHRKEKWKSHKRATSPERRPKKEVEKWEKSKKKKKDLTEKIKNKKEVPKRKKTSSSSESEDDQPKKQIKKRRKVSKGKNQL